MIPIQIAKSFIDNSRLATSLNISGVNANTGRSRYTMQPAIKGQRMVKVYVLDSSKCIMIPLNPKQIVEDMIRDS